MRKRKVERREVIRIRAKGQYLGRVKAKDKKTARKAPRRNLRCALAKTAG